MNATIQILWPKTKANVLGILKKYNYYILSIVNNDDLKIDENYKIEVTIFKPKYLNIDEKEFNKRIELITKVIKSFNKLSDIDKKIIYKNYLSSMKINNDIIANDLGFSVKHYYKIKKEAIIKLAFALGVEVLREEGNNENE
jgi:ArpU family phage transcriptional regulator